MKMAAASALKFAKLFKNGKGFDMTFDKITIVSAERGQCLAELKMEHGHTNSLGGLHGGFSAALVDAVSNCALATHKSGATPSFPANMKLTYVKSARTGDHLQIDARTLGVGEKMAFLDVTIKNKFTGDLLVKATQCKYLDQDFKL